MIAVLLFTLYVYGGIVFYDVKIYFRLPVELNWIRTFIVLFVYKSMSVSKMLE